MKILNNSKIKKFKYGIITTLVILISLFWDLFFKIITDGFSISIIPGFFWFESSHNYGAAYGIFSGQTVFLIVISIIVLGAIFVYNWFNKKKTIFYCISLGLICGGAVGNLIDRIFLGYVRDFIRFSFFSFNFNIADACLTVGVILFAIYLIFFDDFFKFKKQPQQKLDNNIIKNQENSESEDIQGEKTYKEGVNE